MLSCLAEIKRVTTRSGPKKPATAPTNIVATHVAAEKVPMTMPTTGRSIFTAV
jgi:hypothetical protein